VDEGRKGNLVALVFHHADSAVFIAAKHRSKAVVMRSRRLAPGITGFSDRYGRQMGGQTAEHQVCLAHLIRTSQYAIDSGDAVFAPRPEGLAQARLRHRASTRRSYRRHAKDSTRLDLNRRATAS